MLFPPLWKGLSLKIEKHLNQDPASRKPGISAMMDEFILFIFEKMQNGQMETHIRRMITSGHGGELFKQPSAINISICCSRLKMLNVTMMEKLQISLMSGLRPSIIRLCK